jgi:hypothetical protein
VSLRVSGVVADAKTYFYDTDNEEEALYLCGFLNAPTIDKLIKPMQSRGLFGERDIHKKVLELPIPKFDPKNKLHKNLVELARICETKVKRKLPELSKDYTAIGKIRQMVKQELEPEIAKIDQLVKQILVEQDVSTKNLRNYI